jgi:hypothetical protein
MVLAALTGLGSASPPMVQAVFLTDQARSTSAAVMATCCEPTHDGGTFCHGCVLGDRQATSTDNFGPWSSDSGGGALDQAGRAISARATQESRLTPGWIHAEGSSVVQGSGGARAYSDFVVEFDVSFTIPYKIEGSVAVPSAAYLATVELSGSSTETYFSIKAIQCECSHSLAKHGTLSPGHYKLEAHSGVDQGGPASYSVDLWLGTVGLQTASWSSLKEIYRVPK